MPNFSFPQFEMKNSKAFIYFSFFKAIPIYLNYTNN